MFGAAVSHQPCCRRGLCIQPYLSPEFPWNSALTPADAKEEQHILSAVGKWGTMPNRMAARSFASASSSAARSRSEERQALLHYLHCLGLSLPHRQQLVHRVIQSFIVVPCVAMCVGVWRQTLPASGVRVFRPDDEKAVVSISSMIAVAVASCSLSKA
jgi:hypothetical protein